MLSGIKLRKYSLAQAVLASTLLLSTPTQAALIPYVIDGINLAGILPAIPPLQTTLLGLSNLIYNNTIQIGVLGQLSGAATALKIDDLRNIQINAGNLNLSTHPNDAIFISPGSGNGIQLSSGSNNSTVTVGAGSNINVTGSGSGIVIDALVTNISIDNSGKIQSTSGSGIDSSGALASMKNGVGGIITSASGSGLKLESGSAMPDLINQGTISTTSNTSTVNAIHSLGNITGTINNSGSITAVAGSGLALLNSTLPVGSIINSGTISSGSTGSGIESQIPITGSITNNASALIQSSAGTALNLAGGSLGGSIINNGIISSNGVGSAISSNIPITGDLSNGSAASILSSNGTGLNLMPNASIANLNNQGIISTNANNINVNAINSLGNITGAITNSGSITAVSGTALALLGSTAPLSSLTNSGNIASSGAGSAIESSIAITGNITNDATKTIQSALGSGLNLSGGSLGGSIINNGTMSSNGTGSGIKSAIGITNDLLNNSTGFITSNQGIALNLVNGSSIKNLNNQGVISTNSSTSTVNAINCLGNITGAITNGGSITAVSGSALALLGSTLPVSSITNSGLISSDGIGSAIESAVAITGNITNDATKTIHSLLGTGLNLSGGSLGGSIINNGTISSGGTGAGIQSLAAISNDLLNNNTGSITSSGGNALSLVSGSSLKNLNNQGLISTDSGNVNIHAINLAGNMTGDFINDGTISALSGKGVNLASAVINGSLNNSNTIISQGSAPAITLDALSNIKGGIINSGIIKTTTGSTAIDLSNSLNSVQFINNLNGVVTGDVGLSQVAQNLDSVFQMNNGIIQGAVRAAGGNGASTLNIAGGQIVSGILLSDKPDVVNQSGGSIGELVGSAGKNQTLNILGNVVTSGAISNVDNITVDQAGQFTVNHLISGLDTLALKQSPVNIPNVIQNVDFIQNPGNVLNVELKDVNNFGNMVLAGATNTLDNSIVKITLAADSVIHAGDEFKILDSTLNPITGQITLIQPVSALLNFVTKESPTGLLNGSLLTLVAELVYNSPLNSPLLDILTGLSSLTNLDLLNFLSQLNQLPSESQINQSLNTLTPNSNAGSIDLAQRMLSKIFDGISDRVYYYNRPMMPVPSGDEYGYRHAGPWTRVIGTYAQQGEYHGVPGYNSRSGGVVIGYDGCYRNNTMFGAALSYSFGDVNEDSLTYRKQNLESYQVTGYYMHDYGAHKAAYLDVMAALAYDKFSNAREILAGNALSFAHGAFDGWQFGVQLESGYRFVCGDCSGYQFIPVAKFRYSNIALQDYTETGSGLGLIVDNDNVGELVTGVGFKLRSTNRSVIPEFRFNVLYDWIAQTQSNSATFIAGGDPFITEGLDVPPMTYNLGLTLSGEIRRNLVLSLSYDADLKSKYTGHAGSVRFKYLWS